MLPAKGLGCDRADQGGCPAGLCLSYNVLKWKPPSTLIACPAQ